jgi:hypothetical protein
MNEELEAAVRKIAAVYFTLKRLLDPTAVIREAYLASLRDRVLKLKPPAEGGNLETLLEFVEKHGPSLPLRQLVGVQRKLLGFVCGVSPECEELIKVMSTLASEYSDCGNVAVEDMSADSLTVKYIIERHSPSQIIIYTLKRRGRAPGLYTREFKASEGGSEPSLERLGASLRGSLDIDDLLGGLAALGVQQTVTVVECEPSEDKGLCKELIREHAAREVASVCA